MKSLFSYAVVALSVLFAPTPAHADPRLNVVELFQSQGCSSCPPANANVMALMEREDVLALSFAVTYWDYLGWKDTFGNAAFTERQHAYARGLGHDEVYTPQVVVNGRADLTGIDRPQLETAIRRNLRPPFEPVVSVSAGKVSVGAWPRPADVWLVWYDPRTVQVPIQRGENGGRTLPHRNVVHLVSKLGEVSASSKTAFALPKPDDPAWRGAILVQQPGGGAIIAATRVS